LSFGKFRRAISFALWYPLRVQSHAVALTARQPFGMQARKTGITALDRFGFCSATVALTARHSFRMVAGATTIFTSAIIHIVLMSASEQMQRIDTTGIIAAVADKVSVGNKSAVNLECYTVCQKDGIFDTEATITASGSRRCPNPTLISGKLFINFRPKACDSLRGILWGSHLRTSILYLVRELRSALTLLDSRLSTSYFNTNCS